MNYALSNGETHMHINKYTYTQILLLWKNNLYSIFFKKSCFSVECNSSIKYHHEYSQGEKKKSKNISVKINRSDISLCAPGTAISGGSGSKLSSCFIILSFTSAQFGTIESIQQIVHFLFSLQEIYWIFSFTY